MSRYYRTSMGDTAPSVPLGTRVKRTLDHVVDAVLPEGATPKASARSSGESAKAPPQPKRPSVVHHVKRVDHRSPAVTDAAAAANPSHRLLLVGGACVGLGVLVLFLTGDRRRRP